MLQTRLRYRDLKERGVRPKSPDPSELDSLSRFSAWLDSRPADPKPAPIVKGRRGRPRKAAAAAITAT